MRIVYVLTSLGMGGAERQVLSLAQRMADNGHVVALLVLRPPLDEEWPTNLEVFRLNMYRTPLSVLAGLERGRRFLRRFRPDVVHSHGFHGNFIARMLRFTGSAPRTISTIHNFYEGGWRRMLAYRLTDPLSLRTTAVSQAAADRFVRLKAVPRRKCGVLFNGIDVAEFFPSTERREAMRAQLKVDNQFVWLSVGRIVPAKDYPKLLAAFAHVRAVEAGVQLWIAGEADAAEAAHMQALTADQAWGGSVRWLGLRRDLPALLDASDAFVLGSAWEGMPLAAGEAMAMEKPVVATDAGGTGELLGEAGVVVPPRNASALAAAMLAMMRMTAAERLALGRLARERICARFSMESKASEWEALYKSVLKN